jgi:hypothetical protein
MEAAFKRAAYKAIHGTREERSGRFLPAKGRGNSSLQRGAERSGMSRRKMNGDRACG